MVDPVSLVVNPIVDRIIGSAASLIEGELRSVLRVKDDVAKLKSNLSAIKAVLQDAEREQPSKAEDLRDRVEKLQNAAYDAEDILDMFVANKASLSNQKQKVCKIWPPPCFSKIYFQCSTAHNIKDISESIEEIHKQREKLSLPPRGPPKSTSKLGSFQNDRDTSFFVETTDVIGREFNKEEIIKLLLSDESDKDGKISVVPIYGLGGMGKTTLAQSIFNDERVKNHFNSDRMWVWVGNHFNVKKILEKILEYSMKLESNVSSKTQRERQLEQFLNGKRYLLVLDDVWNEDYMQWDELRKCLNHGEKGSKILVTTRIETVANKMRTQRSYPLESLPEDKCWSLFRKIAFTDDNLLSDQPELEDIGKKIVRKCNGVPLAVKAMGGLLRNNVEENKWRRVLESRIWELEVENPDKNKPNILPALKLSYDDLHPNLKQCFVYCSIFPKGYAFDRDVLVKLWMALKFIETVRPEKEEETGQEYFHAFLVRSFFQVQHSDFDDKDRYYMHDLIHDLAQFIAGSSHHYCQVNDENLCSSSENSRHLSLLCKDIEQSGSQVNYERPCSSSQNYRDVSLPCKDIEQSALSIVQNSQKLRTLLFPTEYSKDFGQALEKIFCMLKYLRVLDLSSSMIKELPNSIEKLKLLCFLDLSGTKIKALPKSICNLYNLQTLKLLRCLLLIQLPKDLIKLVNLRFLELDEIFWFRHSVPPKPCALPPGIGNLTRLHTLLAFYVGCYKSGYGIEELKDMTYLSGTLHILKLENAEKSGDCNLIQKENLQKLVLKWSDERARQDEAAEERVLAGLQPHSNLKELEICHYRGAKIPDWRLQNLVSLSLSHCTKCIKLSLSGLRCLKALFVKEMQELETWQNGEFPYLTTMKISNCPKLSEVPESLPKLNNLKIKNCKSLSSLPITPHLLSLVFNGTFVNAISNASSLQTLFISNISNLASFPKWPHLPQLNALYIDDCRKLVSLSEEVEGSFLNLTSLKILLIRGCPNLVKLPDEGLPTALEFLSIASCPKLKSLGVKGTFARLISLKDFYIGDCPKIHSFPDDFPLNSLQNRNIQDCPALTKMCQDVCGEGPEWPVLIKSIPDVDIDSIKESQGYQPLVHGAGEMEPAESTSSARAMSSQMKKTWIDKKSGYKCVMLYPMSLDIAWRNNRDYWSWKFLTETTRENIVVAKLKDVCWLDVGGKLKMSELSTGVEYEIIYVVKLKKGASGWEVPVMLRLSLPSRNVQERRVSLFEIPRGKWMELSLGNFSRQSNSETGEVCFNLAEIDRLHWKSGLIIKGVIVRPMNS